MGAGVLLQVERSGQCVEEDMYPGTRLAALTAIDSGITCMLAVALAPTSDAQIVLETAIPAVNEALAVGVRPGLSIDVDLAALRAEVEESRAHILRSASGIDTARAAAAVG
ncbi:hypothetical protein [Couchioplanes caeruleus]|uniref:Uncharacterized protein n=1 Tax=Couchioplanes caeruleus subsp. caeruleus TaxID=56427 RepID=A0A1K0GL29_9ACTN|nr:hypothetical protein [Couchioplanes caeruleus]OJF11708.1 hypothetical protein BG844_24760 [Couchioplanes caeruleus subsp. caeruleus]